MPPSEKPKLKAIIIPVFRVHYGDLEKYIQTVFGFEFDFLFATGFTHGMCPEYQVTGVIPATMEKQAKDLWLGRRSRNIALILNVLAGNSYIPTGKYIIDTHKPPELTSVYRSLLLKLGSPSAPECLRFKEAHKDNKELMGRIAVLDQAIMDQRSRSRR